MSSGGRADIEQLMDRIYKNFTGSYHALHTSLLRWNVEPFDQEVFGMHRYLEIRNQILNRIQNGDWSQGMQLPSETTLAKEYHTTRVTIRRALQLLEQEHVLTSRQGIGRFVAQSTTSKAAELSRLVDWRQFMREPNQDLRTVTIASHDITLSLEYAHWLQCPDETAGYQFVQSRICTNQTVSMSISIFCREQLPTKSSDGALLDALKRREEMSKYAESDILIPDESDPYANYLQDCEGDSATPILILRQLFLDWRHMPLFLRYDYLNLRVFSLHVTREKEPPTQPDVSRAPHHALPRLATS